MTKKLTLSVLLTAHREGPLAHRTLLSLKAALANLDTDQSFEVLVHMDNPDQETEDYFDNQSEVSARVFKNSFKDLGSSRNYLVEQANGRFAATLDADDLISENWLKEGLKQLADAQDIVVHPEYSVNFGQDSIIWPKTNSKSLDIERLINVSMNRWDSAMICSVDTLKKFPYPKNAKGFAPEDWHFNSQTLNAGVKHQVVPKTTLFVRRKDVSEMSKQRADFSTLHYTDLLDISKVKQIDRDALPPMPKNHAQASQEGLGRHFKQLGLDLKAIAVDSMKIFSPTRKALVRIKELRSNDEFVTDLPDWLISQWHDAHKVDKSVYPLKETLEETVIYRTDHIKPAGYAYKEIVDQLKSDRIDHLILIPWLIHGGADLLGIRYANLLSELYPNKHIAVFTTEPVDSPWASKLGSNVSFASFGQIAKHMGPNDRLKLLSRLVVQAKTPSIQVINSQLGYDWISRHRTLLNHQPIKLYAAAYCQAVNPEGQETGYIHTELPKVYDLLDGIFTDNENTVNKLVAEYGFDHKKFSVHYQPVDQASKKWKANESNKFLWASRISAQKRPDLLIDIAKQLNKSNNLQIDAYGTANMHFDNVLESTTVSNLNYKGAFDGFDSLPLDNYRGLIYTADYDGIPNLILEAMNAGLPIISSNIGGISEVITDSKNGYLVDNQPDEFVGAIEKLSSKSVDELKSFGKRSAKKLADQHSQESYREQLKNDIIL